MGCIAVATSLFSSALFIGAPPSTKAAVTAGRLIPLNPARLIDTRITGTPIGPGGTLPIQIAGKAGVPGDALAVVMNLTLVPRSAQDTHLTVWPSGQQEPITSSVNSSGGQVTSNSVITEIGTNGQFSTFNAKGTVDVIYDVLGYFAVAGSGYVPVDPTRLVDTRTGLGGRNGPLGHGESHSFRLADVGPVPANATGVAINLTFADPTAATHGLVWATGTPQPVASVINANPGQTVNKFVIATPNQAGFASVYNHAGSASVIIDVVGYYTDTSNSSFHSVTPARLLDTRTINSPLRSGETRSIKLAGGAGVPDDGAVDVVMVNLTAVSPTAPTHLTVWPEGPMPQVSALNAGAGQVVANLAFVEVNGAGLANFYNAAGDTHLIIDTLGYDMPVPLGVPESVNSTFYSLEFPLADDAGEFERPDLALTFNLSLQPPIAHRPQVPPYYWSRLSLGSRGYDVRALQSLLVQHGVREATEWQGDKNGNQKRDVQEYTSPISGAFDDATKKEVIKFQRRKNLVQDGIVGEQTWQALVIPTGTGTNKKGYHVRAVMWLLIKAGYPLDQTKRHTMPAKNEFTQAVKDRVIEFQRHNVFEDTGDGHPWPAMRTDGFVDGETWQFLTFHFQLPPRYTPSICLGTDGGDDTNTYRTESWGTSQMVTTMRWVGDKMSASPNEADRWRVAFRDFSFGHGGAFPVIYPGRQCPRQHCSHQHGLDVDVRPMVKPAHRDFQCSNKVTHNTTNSDKFDQAKTTELIQSWQHASLTELGNDLYGFTYFNHLYVRNNAPRTKQLVGHDDHLHIRGCVDGAHPMDQDYAKPACQPPELPGD